MAETINLATGQASSNTLMYLLLAGLGIAVLSAYGAGNKIGQLITWPNLDLSNLFGGNTGQHVPQYDYHGCDTTLSAWCPGLKGCVPYGLTCPEPLVPYVPHVDPVCSEGFSIVNHQCVRIPGTEPIENPILYTPGQSDWCTWPNGDLLSVPLGMDCETARESMCKRFSSIPGYKGCP